MEIFWLIKIFESSAKTLSELTLEFLGEVDFLYFYFRSVYVLKVISIIVLLKKVKWPPAAN